MHFAPPTAGLDLPCAVPNFTAIPAVTANPHTRYMYMDYMGLYEKSYLYSYRHHIKGPYMQTEGNGHQHLYSDSKADRKSGVEPGISKRGGGGRAKKPSGLNLRMKISHKKYFRFSSQIQLFH